MAQCRRTADLDEPSTYPIIFGRAEHRAYTLLDTFSLSTREFDADERSSSTHDGLLDLNDASPS